MTITERPAAGGYLHLLGEFRYTTADGLDVRLTASRLQSLVAWAALSPGLHERARIAELFWPDLPEGHARNNLRQLLHQLRRAWPGHRDFLGADGSTLGCPDRVATDVLFFEQEFGRAQKAWQRGDRHDAARAVAAACRVYGGPLLPGCDDAWVVERRGRLDRQAIQAFDLLARLHEEHREIPEAIECVRRAIAIDPLRERSHLRLMRLHALHGDRAGALEAYDACVRLLRRELDAAPSAELQDAAARITAMSLARGAVRPSEAPTSPLVGREESRRRLVEAWEATEPDRSVLVLILGEAGLGKTRLAEELLTWASAQGLAAARARAYQAEGRLALAPVAEWLRDETIRPAFDRVDEASREECARLVPELLPAVAGRSPRPHVADYGPRRRFFDALARTIRAAAPALILLLDDLQWCEADTLEWLHYLLRVEAPGRLLVVATARDDETGPDHPLTTLRTSLLATGQLTEIALDPLDAAETARLAAAVGGHALETADALRLFADTQGNPLFVVETVRAGVVPARGEIPEAVPALPPRVQAVIMSRLHHLSPDARELAGVAAAVGGTFGLELLASAAGLEEVRAGRALDELWQRKIIREAGGMAEHAFDFGHDRIRDVVYAALSPVQRRLWHRRLAAVLEVGGDTTGDHASQIAAHYESAGEPVRALPHYERAVQAAQRVHAYEQSRTLLERLLAIAGHDPDPDARSAIELRALLMLAAAIRVTRGWASPDLEPVHARVVELSKRVGTPEERAAALATAAFFYEVRADYRRVSAMIDDVRRAVERAESPSLGVMAATASLGEQSLTGRFVASEATYQETLALYDVSQHETHVALTGADFGVLQRAWSSHSLWALGRTREAFGRVDEAVQLARRLAHPFSEALALAYLATLYQLEGDVAACETAAAASLDMSQRFRVIYYAAWSGILLAWTDAVRSPSAAAGARVHERIEAFLATGAGARLPYYLCLAADARARAGDLPGALSDLDRAADVALRQGDAWYDAGLHRDRAAVLSRLGRRDDALASARLSLDIAERQQAPAFEARATAILSGLDANARTNA